MDTLIQVEKGSFQLQHSFAAFNKNSVSEPVKKSKEFASDPHILHINAISKDKTPFSERKKKVN